MATLYYIYNHWLVTDRVVRLFSFLVLLLVLVLGIATGVGIGVGIGFGFLLVGVGMEYRCYWGFRRIYSPDRLTG